VGKGAQTRRFQRVLRFDRAVPTRLFLRRRTLGTARVARIILLMRLARLCPTYGA